MVKSSALMQTKVKMMFKIKIRFWIEAHGSRAATKREVSSEEMLDHWSTTSDHFSTF